MESNRRYRERRGRRRNDFIAYAFKNSKTHNSSLSFNNFCSVLVASGLIAIVYLLLEYHCSSCHTKCDLKNITRNIENITSHLSDMKESYESLREKVTKFSHEFPKLEGQLEILEKLANTLESGETGWNPKTHLPLPNVDVSVKKNK